MSLPQIFKDLKSDIVCAVCLGTLKNPRLLHCGHRFCTKCLRPLERPSIACPLCKQVTHKRTSELPGDTLAKRVRTELNQLVSAHEHRQCDVCQGGQTECRCFDCHTSMCGKCLEKHNGMYRDDGHGIVKQDRNKVLFCAKHGADLSSLCLNCGTLVCNSCVIGNCSDHKRIAVTKAIQDYFRTRHEKRCQTEYIYSNYEALDAALSNVCDSTIQQIKEHTHKLIGKIHEDSDNLVGEIEMIRNRAKSILKASNSTANFLDSFRHIKTEEQETGIPSLLFANLPLLVNADVEKAKDAFSITHMKFIKNEEVGVGQVKMTLSKHAEAITSSADANISTSRNQKECKDTEDEDDETLSQIKEKLNDSSEIICESVSPSVAPLIYGCQQIYTAYSPPGQNGSGFADIPAPENMPGEPENSVSVNKPAEINSPDLSNRHGQGDSPGPENRTGNNTSTTGPNLEGRCGQSDTVTIDLDGGDVGRRVALKDLFPATTGSQPSCSYSLPTTPAPLVIDSDWNEAQTTTVTP